MRSMRRFQVVLLIGTLTCSPVICGAQITLALTKGFVKKYKDKATISTSLKVDQHHDHPNASLGDFATYLYPVETVATWSHSFS